MQPGRKLYHYPRELNARIDTLEALAGRKVASFGELQELANLRERREVRRIKMLSR